MDHILNRYLPFLMKSPLFVYLGHFSHLTSINALCCYLNVNGAIRNLSLNTSTAPIFLQFNDFRKNIWVRMNVQFHFLYIFVGRVDRIHKTLNLTMLFLLFPSDLRCFGDGLNRYSKWLMQIFGLMKI